MCAPNYGTPLLNLKYTCDSFANHLLHFNAVVKNINPLTPELNPSKQCRLLKFLLEILNFIAYSQGEKSIPHRPFLQN
jgi:hypothetical protein